MKARPGSAPHQLKLLLSLLALSLLVVACGGGSAQEAWLVADNRPPVTTALPASEVAQPATTTTAAAPSTTRPARATAAPAARAPAAAAAPAGPARARSVHDQAWTPFASVGGVVLRHPSARVERVGFHEANHDGTRQLEPLPTAADPVTLEGRGRGTGSRSAADVVVDPGHAIRSPVTGRVLVAGSYVLYCDHTDDYVVIAPDAQPGWQVKVFHISGVQVAPGARVEAGQTVLAPGPTRLPFPSQVDEVTARPPWPHVHVEVVDPSIPDIPNGGGC